MREIAADTGLSIATVSRVINGHPHVAPDTRERVEQAVARLGVARAQPAKPAAVPDAVPRRRIRALPVPGDRLLRTDRLVDRRDTAAARSTSDPRCRRGAPAGDRAPDPARPGGHRRRHPHPAAGAGERNSKHCGATGFPFVVVDPAHTPAPRHPGRIGRPLHRGPGDDRAPVELGHRRIGVVAGPTQLARREVTAGRAHLGAGRRRRAGRSRARPSPSPRPSSVSAPRSELLDLPRPAHRHHRVQRQGRGRCARGRRRTRPARARRTCRSPASTTSTWPASRPRG